MYLLMNGEDQLAQSETEIAYSEELRGWQVGRDVIADAERAFTVTTQAANGYRTTITKMEYFGLLEPQEEALIRITASEDVTPERLAAAKEQGGAVLQGLMAVASLAVMIGRIEALGPNDTFDLNAYQSQKGLDLLAAMNLITPERRAEIALGVPT
ncbi:MAG: hypothetical protein AAF330_01585 [Pseudomonadota bacterium]